MITNAVHYSPDLTPIDVTIQVKPQHIIIQVADKGEGIPTTEQAQILD